MCIPKTSSLGHPHIPSRAPLREDADKSDTSSAKSGRSTYQKRFKSELLYRDNRKCLLCNSEDALIGAHIVDAKANLSIEEKKALFMENTSDRYSIYNGLLLCANCHSMYDHWQLGVDEDGNLIKSVTDSGWVRDMDVNVYPIPSEKHSSPKNPWPILLKWKYDRFQFARNDP